MSHLFKIMLRSSVVAAILASALFGGLFFFNQEGLIFIPETLPPEFQFRFPGPFEEVQIPVDGAILSALHFKADRPKGVILYFHGNAGSLKGWGGIAPVFTSRGYDLFIYDYRGFGKSTGGLSGEKALLGDGAAVYAHLSKQFPEAQIILYGRSIGTGIAVHLASRLQPRMLILESPYLSLRDLAAHHYPLIPGFMLDGFLKYPLRSDLWIARVACPVIIFHGTADGIIPLQAGEALSKQVQTEHRFVRIDGGGHNDLGEFPLYNEQLDIILR